MCPVSSRVLFRWGYHGGPGCRPNLSMGRGTPKEPFFCDPSLCSRQSRQCYIQLCTAESHFSRPRQWCSQSTTCKTELWYGREMCYKKCFFAAATKYSFCSVSNSHISSCPSVFVQRSREEQFPKAGGSIEETTLYFFMEGELVEAGHEAVGACAGHMFSRLADW